MGRPGATRPSLGCSSLLLTPVFYERLRPLLAERDVEVTIPMTAGVDSLNVGVAVAIALYQLARR